MADELKRKTAIHDSRFTIHEAERPKEMEAHTYGIMNRVEDTHWWFVGRRAILESFMGRIADEIRGQKSGDRRQETGDGRRETEVGKREVGFRDQESNSPGTHHSSLITSNDLSPQSVSPSTSEDLSPKSSSPVTHHSRLRILDVGCGTGANLEMLANFGDAEGVDVSDEALTFCKGKGLKVHNGLAEELPFKDGEFDVATGLDVIEHLDDDIAGLREMNRVLKPGGRILLFVPAFMWLWGVQDDISHHRIRYTRKQITERVRKAGFSIERATYANITFFAPILLGRVLMRLTGIKPESENNVNVSALNGIFGKIFGAERHWLRLANLPFGVSIVVVAKKI